LKRFYPTKIRHKHLYRISNIIFTIYCQTEINKGFIYVYGINPPFSIGLTFIPYTNHVTKNYYYIKKNSSIKGVMPSSILEKYVWDKRNPLSIIVYGVYGIKFFIVYAFYYE